MQAPRPQRWIREENKERSCGRSERRSRTLAKKQVHEDLRKRAGTRPKRKRTKSRRRTTMASQAFLQARDFLLRHRDDYATAYKDFSWPELTEFNWALDWLDEYARSNLEPALWVVEESGEETKLSYAELS